MNVFTLVQARQFWTALAVLFCAITVQASAQNLMLSGSVRDGANNQALPLVGIAANNGAETVAKTNTDDNGRFSFSLPAGKYMLTFTSVGYKTEKRTVTIANKDLFVPISLFPVRYLLQEVSVFSRSSNDNIPDIERAGMLSMNSETVQKNGGILKDALRAAQTMPGAIGTNELSGRMGVRGGLQDENLVLVNGTQVFEPFHAKYAGSAAIGVFNTDLVKKIDLVNGGFSAEYGDRMSSVLNIQYRDGRKDRIGGQAGVSLTNVDALVEGPIGEHGSFIVGARQSFTEFLVGLLVPDERIKPSFYDVQGQVSYNLSSRDNLTFQFVHSGDRFQIDPDPNSGKVNYATSVRGELTDISGTWTSRNLINSRYGSTMLNLRSRNVVSPTLILRTEVSYYDQFDDESYSEESTGAYRGVVRPATPGGISPRTYYQYDTYKGNGYNRLNVQTLEARSIADVEVSSLYQIRAGLGYQNLAYKQQKEAIDNRTRDNSFNTYPDTLRQQYNGNSAQPYFGFDTRSFKANGFIENIFQIDESLLLNIGGRFDYFDLNRDLNLSPRVNVSYSSPLGITFRAAWGLYFQSPLYRQLLSYQSSDTNTKAQRAIHYVASAERRFSLGSVENSFLASSSPSSNEASLTLKVDAYYKDYSNVISANRDLANRALSTGGILYPTKRNDARASARGVDVFLAFMLGRLNGWLSYGLLEAREALLRDTIYDANYSYARFTDQRHAAALVTDYDFGEGWSGGVRYTFGSGYAYTPYVPIYREFLRQWTWAEGEKNSAHLPAYQRLDIRIDKRLTVFGLNAAFYLDISNVTNNPNVYTFNYTLDGDGKPVRKSVTLWPIIPTLGFTVMF